MTRNPDAPERVLLLVNMGTEGWNCPSLFATALVRKLANSNNFVLQAATRCLRQVPGNTIIARVYLTDSNKKRSNPNWLKPTAHRSKTWVPSRPSGWSAKSCCTGPTCRRCSSKARASLPPPGGDPSTAPLHFTVPTDVAAPRRSSR